MVDVLKIAENGELAEGMSKIVHVKGRTIALFRVKDEYYAISNFCLHRGGPLADGVLEDHRVTCPWHGWKYDIRDGSFTVIPTLKVKSYPVRQREDGVFIEVPDDNIRSKQL
jgi:nitrite reductase (NADH) small subunit/3-phenylpropionate/trans-cinnamate dioxygenase ferredoxin subunit